MFNGAVIDSKVGIEQAINNDAAMYIVNSTFYNNDIGIVSDASASTVQVVADTTIV